MDDRLRKEAGRAGEATALAHLERAGLQLVIRNFRCKGGEIDLVMLDGATLVLVEVRYRSSERFGGAAASVTWRKQRRLANAAEYLLIAHQELRRYPARFDVVAISAAPEPQIDSTRIDSIRTDSIRIDWIKSAFTL